MHIYACLYTCMNIYNSNMSAHRACESLRGKAKAFLKYILLSWQSCCQTVSSYGWDCPAAAAAFVKLLLALRGLAQLDIHWTSQPFALLHRDAAGSQEWLMPKAAGCSGSGRALYSGGNRRSRLGEELPELHRLTFWECESQPLAMPPAVLSQLRTDAAAGFVTRSVFVFQ